MDVQALVEAYGLWGLGGLCFVGATLVPFSSEVAVVAALKLGWVPWQVFVSASLGNALGASTNYFLGLWAAGWVERKLEESRAGRRALGWTRQYGRWALLGSWLPVVGDPLCLAAGLARVDFIFFVTVGLGTRLARYLVLILLFK